MTTIQAIDLLKGLEQSLDDYCELNDEGKTAFRMGIIALELFGNAEQLSSVQPEQKWIPCSERLPEVSDYYLIQHPRRICPDEMAVAFYSVEEAELDKNYTWEFKPFADCEEVIAWMPLPKPYKESEKNHEG